MDILEYLTLTSEDQWDYLWLHGHKISTYSSIDSRSELYKLDNFYVEVELDLLYGHIIGKNIFKEGAILRKFLEFGVVLIEHTY